MEKTKNKKWYHYLIIYTLGFIIYTSMVLTITYCINNKKAGAYTNNVVTYANEQITNLTGSTWQFNDNLNYSQNINATYNIDYECSSSGNEFDCYSITFTYTFDYEILGRYSNNYLCIIYQGGWNGPTPQTQIIKINGGTDTTNSELINLLYSQATLISVAKPETYYNINYNLQNVIIIGEKPTQISNLEEIEIEIQNFNNYELPQNIMVENASYNWNYETGILTIYDATGNVNITIRAEYISGNYSFIELIDSVVLIPLNTFFNLFNFELFGVNIYALLTATLTLFVIIKILLKVFK